MTQTAFARTIARRSKEAGTVSVGVLAILFLIGTTVARRHSSDRHTAAVERGPFRSVLVEPGTLTAARLLVYASAIAGTQAKIVELAPEGSAVKPGDLLVRFDSTGFEQNLAREQAALGQARAELARAREDLRLEELRSSGELDAARQQLGSAEANLENQTRGRGELEVLEAEAALAEAMREATRTRTAYEDTKPLLAEGFVTRAELERAELAWRRAEDVRRLAEARRDTLVKFERPASLKRSQAELNGARDGIVRQGEAVGARLSQRQAAVVVADSRVAETSARIAVIEQQIAQTTIRAGGSGLVVYRDLFFGGDHRKPQVGDEVWPNQPLIALPDSSQFVAETRVREIDLHRIGVGQHVTVSLDAYPDLRLPAVVSLIGALAQEDPARAGTKFFPLTIKLLGTDARLRNGMTAQVEIETSTIAQATLVPLQAVSEDRAGHFVTAIRGGRERRIPVTLRATNELVAAVDGELAPGDLVLLNESGQP